ncbi:hypothetical protein [Chamaesiphon minutus]|uniref:hypothetical protein n=1 Tax=Chamaesiphon minutus TaxID=1173032 RepID=UPI0002EC5AE5|nr:hypothetical protein [Chamaesiphon minutus]
MWFLAIDSDCGQPSAARRYNVPEIGSRSISLTSYILNHDRIDLGDRLGILNL